MTRRRFRVGLITTLGKNIGDDLIREGIVAVLSDLVGPSLELVAVDKHHPFSVYPRWHPGSWAKRGPAAGSRFENCRLIIQCGAPVFWPSCHRCEWAEPLWHGVVRRLHQRVPVLNLAAGSCYPIERQPSEIEGPGDAAFVSSILDYCRLTSVRDRLARELCCRLGTSTPLIPCSALLAAPVQPAPRPEYVLINYMSGGGHYDWNQGIDRDAWRTTVMGVVEALKRRHRLAFLCHDEKEYQAAETLDASLPRFFPRTPDEYFRQLAVAKAAVCNRMHASVGLAGLGVPSVAVCTDTRLFMVEALGLPTAYVKGAGVEWIVSEVERLLDNAAAERERLIDLRRRTYREYLDAIAGAAAL